MLLVDDIQIESIWMSILGLGKSIYTKKQLEEFTTFQEEGLLNRNSHAGMWRRNDK